MRLTNNKFFYRSIFFLFFLACTEDDSPSVFKNPLDDPPGLTNKLNFQSNSGDEIDYVTLTWNSLGSAVLTDHSSITQTQITPSGNSHVISGMQPGEFRDISIQISITADLTYEDSIQIFTRSIYPVSNFEFEVESIKVGEGEWNSWETFTDLGNSVWDEGEDFIDEDGNNVWDEGEKFTDLGNSVWDEGEDFIDKDTIKYHRNLKWSPTLESQGNYYIYRSTAPSDLLCSTCKIDNLTLLSVGTYIDSSSVVIDEPDEDTFYYMVQVSTDDFIRNSFIYNYTGFNSVGPITGETVSTDKIEFITITWNPISTENLYQYEIWRFKGQPDQGNDTTLVAIIPNITPNLGINHFMDRGDEFMDGTTYYYSVKVVDINGRKPDSDFIEGFSYPW